METLFELAEVKRDFSGETDSAVGDLERALELAATLGDRHLLADGELRTGFLLVADGRLTVAEQALARSAEVGSELGSRRDEARAIFQRAFIAYHRGRPEEAERRALEAQEWFERTGDSYFQVQNLRALSWYATAREDGAEAERRLRDAILLANPTGGWLVSELNADLSPNCSSPWDASTRPRRLSPWRWTSCRRATRPPGAWSALRPPASREHAAIATRPDTSRSKRWRSSSTSGTGSRSPE